MTAVHAAVLERAVDVIHQRLSGFQACGVILQPALFSWHFDRFYRLWLVKVGSRQKARATGPMTGSGRAGKPVFPGHQPRCQGKSHQGGQDRGQTCPDQANKAGHRVEKKDINGCAEDVNS